MYKSQLNVEDQRIGYVKARELNMDNRSRVDRFNL